MKRNLLLLSLSLLLFNPPAIGAESTRAASAGTAASLKATQQTTNSKTTTQQTTNSRKLTIPPPPIETTPGNTRYLNKPEIVAPAVTTSRATDANITVLGQGGGTAKNTRVQRFADYLNINQGSEGAPITMTITNQGFKWFRLLIANQLLATEKTLAGKESCKVDLTGVVGPGTNQIVLEAGGVPGSKLDWKVTTITAAKLDKADPDQGLVGDTIKITGKNFSTKTSEDKVTFNSKAAQVISAKETEMQVKIPSNAELGDNRVVATIRGVKTNAIKVKVLAVPEVSGTNLGSAPPGFKLTIFGRNFAKTPGENKVFLGDTSAPVESGDTTHLNVTVPNIGNPDQAVLGGLDWRQSTPGNYNPTMGSLLVKVQVGKLISKENVQFIIGRQVYPGITGNQYDIGPGTPNPYNAPMNGPTYNAPQSNTPRANTDPDGGGY